MRANLEKFGEVIVLDATGQTNIFQMPLFLVAVKDAEGSIYLGSACLSTREDSDSLSWFMKFMQDSSTWKPRVIFTDGDIALEKSIDAFGGTHFLCLCNVNTE